MTGYISVLVCACVCVCACANVYTSVRVRVPASARARMCLCACEGLCIFAWWKHVGVGYVSACVFEPALMDDKRALHVRTCVHVF